MIVSNNPKIIDLFSYKVYGGPHKGRFEIVNHNPRCTYCQLVPKQYTLTLLKVHLSYGSKILDFYQMWILIIIIYFLHVNYTPCYKEKNIFTWKRMFTSNLSRNFKNFDIILDTPLKIHYWKSLHASFTFLVTREI